MLEIYKLYRPTPLLRARRLEKALGTPVKAVNVYIQGLRISNNQ